MLSFLVLLMYYIIDLNTTIHPGVTHPSYTLATPIVSILSQFLNCNFDCSSRVPQKNRYMTVRLSVRTTTIPIIKAVIAVTPLEKIAYPRVCRSSLDTLVKNYQGQYHLDLPIVIISGILELCTIFATSYCFRKCNR